MTKEYTQEEILEILEKLPEEVRGVLFSEKTADDIDVICKKYKVPSEKISEVAKYAGWILLGILPLEKFTVILENDVRLKSGTAKDISREIEISVFSQVEHGLKRMIQSTEKPTKAGGALPVGEEGVKSPAEDRYREQI